MQIPIASKVLQNVDETALKKDTAALENAFVTEAGSLSRFPHLVKHIKLPTEAPVYLKEWKGDLIAVAGGRTYLVGQGKVFADVTKDAISGKGRTIFAQSSSELFMANGGDIIRYRGDKAELLSITAPKSTHIGYLDGYLISVEAKSGRFSYSEKFEQWDPLDVFSAEGNPDNINSLLVTNFGDLILGGDKSMEQFNVTSSGDAPFFRRWLLGDGVIAPYSLIFANNQIWGLNEKKEFVSFSAQLSRVKSDPIQASLSKLTDFTDAWSQELVIKGQKFIILQIPYAVNVYGTIGLTLLYDYGKDRWSSLYGWQEDVSLPSLWEGRSVANAFGETFIGGDGIIYKLDGFDSNELTNPQRMIWRSGLVRFSEKYQGHINRLIMHVKRGETDVNDEIAPIISLRVRKNNTVWSKWIRRSLGNNGKRNIALQYPSLGMADTWQFEIMVTDKGAIEISEISADVDLVER